MIPDGVRTAFCPRCNDAGPADKSGCLRCKHERCADCGDVSPVLLVTEHKTGDRPLCPTCWRSA